MKYKIHFFLLLAGALFFFGYAKPAEAAISWIPVGSGVYSDTKSTSQSAVVTDSNGVIYSAYADDSVGGKLTVKKFINNVWQTVGTAGLSDSDVISKPFHLYFDAESNLSIAYIEGTTPVVTVSKFNGISWTKSFSQTKSSLGITNAIFTSRNGAAFMVFSDSSDGNKLKAKKFNTASATWDLLGNSSFSATSTLYFAADVDSSGNPYVAYVDQNNSNKVDIKKFNGSSWDDVGTDTVFSHSLNNQNFLLVKLDGADTPYISYSGTQYSYVFKFNGTDWAAVGSSFSYDDIYSLEFDSTNRPYIFYYSVMDLYNFSVKRFNGSTWELFGSARMLGNLGNSGFYGGAYGTPSLIHNYYDGVDHFFIDYVTPSTSNERRMLRYTASRELYINNSLSESAYNDGTVGGQLDIYLTNDSFTSVGKTLVLGKDYSINSPAGLTPTLSVNSSGTIATLKFSGSATYHDQENSISNLAINFTSSAFLGGTASSVLNNPTPNSSITFFNYAYANASIVAGLTSDEVNSSNISFVPYPFFATGSSTPYVVYTSSDGSAYHIKVKKYNGSTWGLAATSIDGVNANFPKASFNSAGEMYLSYLHNSNLVVKKYNGSAWDTVGSSTLPTSLYRASEPVFDSTGNPYIFYVNSKLTAAYVIKFDGSSWVNVGGSYMAQFLSSGSYFHTLAFDSKNNLHVVHRTNGGKPVVSKFDGASWSTLNSGELSSDAFDINIAVGTSDVPYISYTDAAAGKIIVKNFVDGHWITLGDYVSGSSSSYATLRIGSDGVVYVVYSDGVNSGKATLKKFNGTNWELVGQAGFSSEAISIGALDMAISGSNEPYVSHNSSSVKGVVTKMILPPVISNLSAEPTQDQADLSWKVDTGEISNYVVKYKAVERSTWTIFSESPLSGTETTITGLQPSTQYESAVSAVNTLGYYSAPLIVALTTSSSTPPTDFSYSSSSDVLTVGVEYSTSPTVTGKGLSYTVTPSLPEGLLLNQTTGVISGTPTASSKQAVYTVTVSNSSGNLSFELTLSVTVPAPSAVSFSNSKYEFILGLEDNYGTGEPTVSGGEADFFSVSPSLPAGLSINETTGVISGTPTATSSQTTYTVTAENDSGSVSCSVDILILFTRISYFTEPQTFIVNNNVDLIRVSLDDLTYMSPSSVFDSFTVNPEFPAGLTLDSKSGAISGTPTATSSETTYTITASNSAASTTTEITFSVTVNAPDSFYYGEIPSYFLIGSTINSLSPSVNGYYLSYSVSPGLPEGLTIDPETGVISGTPTATSSEATYTITVTNDGGSASVDLTFSVVMAEIEYSSEDYYLKKWDSVEIAPTAFSGLSSCSYELPSGLNVDESTGSIVGQPDTSSSLTSYTITCGGKSASINIAVEEAVVDGYYYVNSSNDYLVFGVNNQAEDQSFALSELYGDNLSFKISPALPSGLNLNSSNGEISGYLMDTLNFKEYEITASNHVASSSHSVKIGAFRTGTSLGKTFDEDYEGYDLVRFNSKGVLYSALNRYNDKTGEYIIEVKKYSPGSGWQLVGNSLVSKTLTILQDFVFDRFDTPTVLYSVDNKSSYNVYVIQYLNSTWQNIGDAISSSNYYGMVAANDNIYFVDSLGNAYVSNNGSWNQIDDGSELNIGGEQFDIIASGDGSLYAAYYSNYTLYVKKYDGESWSAIKTEENIDSPKLELTTDGTLYLSGRDFNNKEDLAAVFKYKNNIWTRLGKETPVYSSPSLTIVNNDPVISFTDSYGVTFIKYDAKNIEDPTMLSYVVPDSSLVSLTSHDSTVAFSSSYKNVSDVIRQYEIISNTGAGKKVNPNELPALVTSGTISPRNGNASSTTAIKFNQRITVEADNGASILIPEGVEMTASSTFKISDISAGVANVSDLSAIDVAGSVSFGLSLQGLTLNQPITITIPVSGLADGIVLPVYTRYAGTSWTHITDCTLSAGVCSFQVDHLSEFATGETVSSQSSSSSSVIAPTCSSVTYSEFSNLCVGGYNYRNFVSQSPNNCSLSAAQIEAARRLCGVTEENNSNSEVKTDTGVNLISRVKQEVINLEKSLVKNISKALSKKLKGRILLQVEEKGEAWYVNPIDSAKYFLGSPTDAFALMRKLALGISNVNFDSFGDKAPVRLAGRILLKVEDNGKAYYVDPNSLKMYYLGRPADAFNLMRSKGLGITNANLRQIVVGE